MRIVAGQLRGRSLFVPKGTTTRPTSDRARQALFNILEHGVVASAGSRVVGARVLDGFAGTGALGLEALSRGADHASFFEQDRAALACLRDNIVQLGQADRCTVIPNDIRRPPRSVAPCGLVFLDPPYGQGLISPTLAALGVAGWLDGESLIVAELAAGEAFLPPLGFTILDSRRYGTAQFLFLQAASHIGFESS